MSLVEGNEAPDYVLEGDKEAERLRRNHECIKYFMGGKLIAAPMDTKKSGLKILDSGTSDGTWIFDARNEVPHDATFVGTDISTDRIPKSPPQGVEFRIQDVNDPWPKDMHNSFDLVHQRLVFAACPDGPLIVKNFYELIKPGGWIQLVEADIVGTDDDGPAHKQFLALLNELFRSFGVKKLPFSTEMAGWLRQNGFENVGERVVPYVIGKKMDEPSLREQGVESNRSAIQGLGGYAKTIPGGLKCMSMEDLDSLEDRWVAEMYERGGDFPMRIVWGQKPAA